MTPRRQVEAAWDAEIEAKRLRTAVQSVLGDLGDLIRHASPKSAREQAAAVHKVLSAVLSRGNL